MKKSILVFTLLGFMANTQADNGNIDNGRQIVKQGYCSTCHGDLGVAPSRNAPSLAGQSPYYLSKVMHEFRSKSIHIDHKSLGMQSMLQPMSNQDISDVAAYYAAQKPVLSFNISNQNSAGACLGCHTTNGRPGLNGLAPSLNGMSAMYIKRQLNAYQNGDRSDTMMNKFSKSLSAEEIEHLSQFYGAN